VEATTAQAQRAREVELLLAVAGGDTAALRELYKGFERPLYSLAMRWLSDPDLAEELVQEVTIRIWKRAKSFDPDRGAPSSWIFGTARNVASDLANAAAKRPVPVEEIREEQSPWDEEASWTSWQVDQALKTLPLDQRRVVEMAFVLQMTQSEIAENLNIPLGTVKTRLYAGLKKARTALGEVGLVEEGIER
jgi:RNA polymerase sigma-70 factor (ECF subfamily)